MVPTATVLNANLLLEPAWGELSAMHVSRIGSLPASILAGLN